MTSRPIAARFDDLRGGGGFALADVGDVLAAHRPDEVADVLRAAEAAARDGNWVAGFVSYEAASGLDPSLCVQSWPVGHPMAVMAALFPCGSVTGAPKRRSMAAIAELEGRPRGVYCGAVGYLEPGQDIPHARFAVAIRTSVVTTTGYAEYGAGGGITYPSQPDCEWDELIAKCAVLGTVVPEAITTARGSTTLVANHSQ